MQLYLESIKGTLMRIFLTILLLLISILSLYVQIDESAMQIYNETFNRAVYSFAIVKGLNALISVIQSTEINLSLFVGANVGIGEILDPINDLVERFSVVMLVSSVSIGVQHLLLLLGKSIFVKVLLLISAFFVLLGLWVKKLDKSIMFIFSIKLFLLLFILRFGAVVFIYSTQFVYNEVYSQEYENSNKYIQTYKDDLEVMKKSKTEFDSLWLKLKDKTETFTKKVIKLITIFVVTTIIFPLLFLWFFIFLIRLIFNIKLDYDKIYEYLNKARN